MACFSRQSKVRVEMRGAPVRERKLYRISGMGTRVLFRAHNNSVNNLLRALNERIYNTLDDGEWKPVMKAAPGVVAERLTAFKTELSKYVPTLLPLSDEQFVNRYLGRKRVLYQKAVDSLQQAGVCKKDAVMKSFIKMEKCDITSKIDACPRLISPRNPRYNVELGKFIAHGEKPMFKAIARIFGYDAVYKGKNAQKSAEDLREAWDKFQDPLSIDLDCKRYEKHYCAEKLKWEHSCWRLIVPRHRWKDFMRLCDMQINNEGRAYVDDGMIKFFIEGGRMSGDMNTSSGNCLTMCGTVYSYMNYCGITKYHLANNGDDCVIIIERRDFARFSEGLDNWFKEIGFDMEVGKAVDVFEEIKFCQTQPVWNGVNWVMVRDPRTALAKDATANCNIAAENDHATWCDAMHHGGTALTAGIPVWQQFYAMFPKNGRKASHAQTIGGLIDSGMWHLKGNMEYRQLPIGPDQRVSFWKAFGILPDDQILLEEQFAQQKLHYTVPTRDLCMEEISVLDAHNPKLLGNTYGEYFLDHLI